MPLLPVDDELGEVELLARVGAGDQHAAGALYDRYAGPLYAFGLRHLGDRQLAEELVQHVLVKLWRNARSYDPRRGSVRTYVFAIARTGATDLHRRQQVIPLPARDPSDVETATDVEAATTDDLDAFLQAAVVRAALDRLSEDHRRVLELGYYRGLTQREVAELLGIPLGTVKSRTYYALRALRLALDELGVHQ